VNEHPRFARTLTKVWALPEELWCNQYAQHSDRVPLEAGSVGEFMGEYTTPNWGTRVAVLRFEGGLIAMVGATAWADNDTEDTLEDLNDCL
jgi:hypothetical protein